MLTNYTTSAIPIKMVTNVYDRIFTLVKEESSFNQLLKAIEHGWFAEVFPTIICPLPWKLFHAATWLAYQENKQYSKMRSRTCLTLKVYDISFITCFSSVMLQRKALSLVRQERRMWFCMKVKNLKGLLDHYVAVLWYMEFCSSLKFISRGIYLDTMRE